MLLPLTAGLVALPQRGWARLRASARTRLPSPSGHAAVLGTAAALATTIGAASRPEATLGGVVAHALCGLLAYLGAGAAAAAVAVRWCGGPHAERFGVAAASPLAISGLPNAVAPVELSLIWGALGAVLTARTAWVGALALLGRRGRRRAAATALVTVSAALPVLAASAWRTVALR